MTEGEIGQQFKKIEVIYKDFRCKIFALAKERNEIINNFLEDLKNKKLEELRKIIASR